MPVLKVPYVATGLPVMPVKRISLAWRCTGTPFDLAARVLALAAAPFCLFSHDRLQLHAALPTCFGTGGKFLRSGFGPNFWTCFC